MTARYQLRETGVWDNEAGRLISPNDVPEWDAYMAYRNAGGEVDPLPILIIPIDERRAVIAGRLDRFIREAMERPYSVGGHSFTLRPDEQAMLVDVALAEAAGLTIPAPLTVYSDDGVAIGTTPANRRNMAERIIARRFRIYERRKALEYLIAGSADPESIDSESGWGDSP